MSSLRSVASSTLSSGSSNRTSAAETASSARTGAPGGGTAFKDALESALRAHPDQAKSATDAPGAEEAPIGHGDSQALFAAPLPSGSADSKGSKPQPGADKHGPESLAPVTGATGSAGLPLPEAAHGELGRQPEGAKHSASSAESQPQARPSAQPSSAKPSPSGVSVLSADPSTRPAGSVLRATTGFSEVLDSRDLQPLLEQAQVDSSLRLNIAPQGAQLSLDTGPNGAIFAQLHILNGIADVRITGAGASDLVRHGAELSLGLTASGLQPGRVEISAASASADSAGMRSDGQSSGSQGEGFSGEGSREHTPPQPEVADASFGNASAVRRPGGIHVKA